MIEKKQNISIYFTLKIIFCVVVENNGCLFVQIHSPILLVKFKTNKNIFYVILKCTWKFSKNGWNKLISVMAIIAFKTLSFLNYVLYTSQLFLTQNFKRWTLISVRDLESKSAKFHFIYCTCKDYHIFTKNFMIRIIYILCLNAEFIKVAAKQNRLTILGAGHLQ